jgi:hypothetical protein
VVCLSAVSRPGKRRKSRGGSCRQPTTPFGLLATGEPAARLASYENRYQRMRGSRTSPAAAGGRPIDSVGSRRGPGEDHTMMTLILVIAVVMAFGVMWHDETAGRRHW